MSEHSLSCRSELPTLDLKDVHPEPHNSLFEDLAQLQLNPTSTSGTGRCSAGEVAGGLRVATSVDPLVTTASSLGALLRLSRQALAGGNLKLGARILGKAGSTPLLQSSPSVRHHLAFLGLDVAHRQGGAGAAVSGLTGLVQQDILPSLRSGVQPFPGRAVPLVQLACWLETGGPVAVEGDLGLSVKDCPGEYVPLLPGLSQVRQAQLFLLLSATELAPQLGVGWAALGNWLHARLAEAAEVRDLILLIMSQPASEILEVQR